MERTSIREISTLEESKRHTMASEKEDKRRNDSLIDEPFQILSFSLSPHRNYEFAQKSSLIYFKELENMMSVRRRSSSSLKKCIRRLCSSSSSSSKRIKLDTELANFSWSEKTSSGNVVRRKKKISFSYNLCMKDKI